jgi:UDP-galactopyranose mutase
MNTFYAIWGVTTPEEAKRKIEEQRKYILNNINEGGVNLLYPSRACNQEPQNLEEQAISLIGKDIYEILIKGYTEKQWGRKCTDLPPFIIKRLPVRFTFDNSYFNDPYQGIPIGGYNKLINGLLYGIKTQCDTDFFENREYFENIADKIVFTGKIDEFYHYRFGKLAYWTVKFETEILDIENYQGNSVVNYTEREIPFTRIIEHKHFEFGTQPGTVISREYSSEWERGSEPFYPVNDTRNDALYLQYKGLADKEKNIIFGGRLAEYKYYDMNKIIEKVLKYFENE